MNNFSSILISIALLVGSVGILVLGYMALPALNSYIRMESVKTCGQISKYTQNIDESNARAEYPVQDIYATCLETLYVQ